MIDLTPSPGNRDREIVSFVGVGILLLIVSYIAPAPGKDTEEEA